MFSAFYDAVVGPAFRTVELQISAGQTGQLEKPVSDRLNAGLPALFPWLKLNTDVDTGRVSTSSRQEGSNIILQAVESAARELVELALHYLVNQPGRICTVGQESPLPSSGTIAASPRLVEMLRRDGGSLPVAIRTARPRTRASSSAMPTGTGSLSIGTPIRQSRSLGTSCRQRAASHSNCERLLLRAPVALK
jgi:hypothetical protein